MLWTKNKNLQDEIVEILLKNGPTSSKKIKSILSEDNKKYSIQAIYKQINILKNENVILKKGILFKIHNEWSKKASDAFNTNNHYPLPEPGEKIIYNVQSLEKLDIMWKDIVYSLYKILPNSNIFSYIHHQHWLYIKSRTESEIIYFNKHKNENRYIFYAMSAESPSDKKFRKKFKTEHHKIEIYKPTGTKQYEHPLAIGNYLVTSIFSENLSKKIDKIYEKNMTINEQIKALQPLFIQKDNCKITVENNLKKSLIFKKRIIPPFVLPHSTQKELKDESEKLKLEK